MLLRDCVVTVWSPIFLFSFEDLLLAGNLLLLVRFVVVNPSVKRLFSEYEKAFSALDIEKSAGVLC